MSVPIYANMQGGREFFDINEDDAASRVGRRIRTIRTEKKMSQAELGAAVGLNADRIQKYENGARKPKNDLLKKIADVLDVNSLSLADPVTTSYISTMYALFEMESRYDMRVEKIDGRLALIFGDGISGSMNGNLRMWYQEYTSYMEQMQSAKKEEREELTRAYHQWEWNFPRSSADESEKRMRKMMIEDTIKQLQDELNKIDD